MDGCRKKENGDGKTKKFWSIIKSDLLKAISRFWEVMEISEVVMPRS